jgi:hypothetical protein
MSDREDSVILPKRAYSNNFGGVRSMPDLCEVDELGEIHYSGIAVFKSLIVWQDRITKQIFWWEGCTDDHDDIEPGDNMYSYFVLYPSRWKRFKHFILGWGTQYGPERLKDRHRLIEAVREALKISPSDEEISCRWSRYAQPYKTHTCGGQAWQTERCVPCRPDEVPIAVYHCIECGVEFPDPIPSI